MPKLRSIVDALVDLENSTDDFWQMPIIENDNFIPKDLMGFNYAKSSGNKDVGIHFYLDDYQFERLWNTPEEYTGVLKQYDCILSPDYSLYLDMPMPMKIWNIYRSRQIGQYYQKQGIKVIPTISWAEEETFSFCFKGIPKGSIVSISTIGVKKNKEALKIWRAGVDEMIKQTPEITFIKVDIEEGDEICSKYVVRSVGTFIKFINGKLIDHISGKGKEGLMKLIQME